jgi:LysM repeat protein
MVRAVIILVLFAALGVAGTALGAGPTGQQRPRVHVVYPGQTLGGIAKRYNVSIDAICTASGIRKTAAIRPKQTLWIPAPGDKDGTQARDHRLGKVKPPPVAEKVAAAPPAATKPVKQSTPTKPPKPPVDPYVKPPKRRGYVVISGPNGSWKGLAVGRDGKVTKQGRDGFEKVLASWRTGKRERIHGRLIRMLAKVSDHFGGRPIRVVSGFRPYSPDQYTPHSQHNLGRAVDFSVEGVPNDLVRDYCRTLGNVGVGYYPNSSFVHLDVREIPTYWVDYSGPGEAPRYARSGQPPPAPAPPAAPAKDPQGI